MRWRSSGVDGDLGSDSTDILASKDDFAIHGSEAAHRLEVDAERLPRPKSSDTDAACMNAQRRDRVMVRPFRTISESDHEGN